MVVKLICLFSAYQLIFCIIKRNNYELLPDALLKTVLMKYPWQYCSQPTFIVLHMLSALRLALDWVISDMFPDVPRWSLINHRSWEHMYKGAFMCSDYVFWILWQHVLGIYIFKLCTANGILTLSTIFCTTKWWKLNNEQRNHFHI